MSDFKASYYTRPRKQKRGRYATELHWVTPHGDGAWAARFIIDGELIQVGQWLREEDAGLAADRARIHMGLPALNFPRRARQLGGASPELLREVAASLRYAGKTSAFLGVRRNRLRQTWETIVRGADTRVTAIGEYYLEADAARAFDREAIKRFGNAAVLNFPRGTARPRRRSLPPLAPPTSEFAGVDATDKGLWQATYYLESEERVLALGEWGSEREAARARDRAAAYYGSGDCHLNFPHQRSLILPASDVELRAEARRLERLAETRGRQWCEGSKRLIRYKGETLSSVKWAKRLGLTREAMRRRLLKPGALPDALLEPRQQD
jgi:hypothetical protein